MLDEGHHLGLEALSVHILHGGHLQAHSDVVFSPEQRVRPSISRHKGKNVTDSSKETCVDLEFSLEKSFSYSMEIHNKCHKANSNNYCA